MDDFRLALLLQKQFKAEARAPVEVPGDQEMARMLQRQFESEVSTPSKSSFNDVILVSSPKGSGSTNSLYYEDRKNKNKDPTKSLVDPSWELVDPTPNVFNLFVAFDQRFFWNKLQMVAVNWSKRMTSCAGICTYQGRGGMCTIALSEPLLKLRPRKDLVETLLHEMIHAYLFVTHNNKDRDGHGPEFHKHMYRINNEAGTNISVYHDFHDEVKLYKQHWWRCDGLCQKRGPFFGIVRRATNRAPGPNDRWWAEHSRNCGGKFIKVQEPEKASKGTKSKEPVKSKNTSSIVPFLTKKPMETPKSNIMSFSDMQKNNGMTNSNSGASTGSLTNSDNKLPKNIVGFKNLSNNKTGGTATKSNWSNTVIVRPKTATKNNNEVNVPKEAQTIQAFSGTGQTLASSNSNNTTSSSQTGSNDYNAVRNHWLNKFENNSAKNPAKRPNDTPACSSNAKHMKTDTIDLTQRESVLCPICSGTFYDNTINAHVDNCLQSLSESFRDDDDFCDNSSNNDSQVEVPCLICEKIVKRQDLDSHLENCNGISLEKSIYLADDQVIECPICKKGVLETEINAHIDKCLS